jgi:hypothetical protein
LGVAITEQERTGENRREQDIAGDNRRGSSENRREQERDTWILH